MKIRKNAKLELLCSKDNYREVLQNVYLNGAKAIATDGNAMAVITVERDETDTDGLIPAKALTEARKLAAKRDETVTLAVNGSVVLQNNATFERPEGQFPDWTQVGPAEGKKPIITVGLNANLLAKLSDALAADVSGKPCPYIALEIYDSTGPMVVKRSTEANEKNADYGLIMPVRLG